MHDPKATLKCSWKNELKHFNDFFHNAWKMFIKEKYA